MDEQRKSFSGFGKIEVAPQAVEKELIKLWRETQPMGVEAGNRVILANFLLLFAENEIDHKIIEEFLTDLTIAHPSRFFVLLISEEKDLTLTSYISSRCVRASNSSHVCSEEVYLRFPLHSVERVPSVLDHLFVSDVPRLFFISKSIRTYRGRDEIGLLLRDCISRASNVFYDSDILPDVERMAGEGEKALELPWFRSGRWRVLVAEQFDGAEDLISRISHIEFRCDCEKKLPREAVLLAAWFATVLSWSAKKCHNIEKGVELSLLNQAGDERLIRFRHSATSDPKEVEAISITFRSDSPCLLRIERNFRDSSARLIRCTESGTTEATAAFKKLASREVIIGALYDLDSHLLYERVRPYARLIEDLRRVSSSTNAIR